MNQTCVYQTKLVLRKPRLNNEAKANTRHNDNDNFVNEIMNFSALIGVGDQHSVTDVNRNCIENQSICLKKELLIGKVSSRTVFEQSR